MICVKHHIDELGDVGHIDKTITRDVTANRANLGVVQLCSDEHGDVGHIDNAVMVHVARFKCVSRTEQGYLLGIAPCR